MGWTWFTTFRIVHVCEIYHVILLYVILCFIYLFTDLSISIYYSYYIYIYMVLHIYYYIISWHIISYHIILCIYIYSTIYIYMYVCVEFEEMPPWLSQVTNPQHHSTLQKVRDLPHLRIKRSRFAMLFISCYIYIYIILYLWYVILINDHRIMYLLVVEWGEPSIMRIINQPVEKEHSANRLELSHQHLPSEVITSGYV